MRVVKYRQISAKEGRVRPHAMCLKYLSTTCTDDTTESESAYLICPSFCDHRPFIFKFHYAAFNSNNVKFKLNAIYFLSVSACNQIFKTDFKLNVNKNINKMRTMLGANK